MIGYPILPCIFKINLKRKHWRIFRFYQITAFLSSFDLTKIHFPSVMMIFDRSNYFHKFLNQFIRNVRS